MQEWYGTVVTWYAGVVRYSGDMIYGQDGLSKVLVASLHEGLGAEDGMLLLTDMHMPFICHYMLLVCCMYARCVVAAIQCPYLVLPPGGHHCSAPMWPPRVPQYCHHCGAY